MSSVRFHQSEAGRAPILLAMMCLAFALGLGASGYLNYVQNQRAKTDRAQLESQITTLKKQLGQASSQPAANKEAVLGTQSVAIAEFSLNVMASDPVSDLTYQIQSNGGYKAAAFTTKGLAAKYHNCKPGALGMLVQRPKSYAPSSISQLVKTVGNYSYYFVAASYNCGQDSSSRAEVSGDQSYLLGTVLPTLSN